MTLIRLHDRLAGGIWGVLVGDAIGVPYEGRPPEAIREVAFGARGTHRQPPGTWSDDGALTLALLDSLLSAGFDPTDQARRALAWLEEGAYAPDGDVFDVGATTHAALRRFADGTAAEDAGGHAERHDGNGSLMRILPVALVGRALDGAELVEHAEAASRVTHAHPVAQVACAVHVLGARRLLTQPYEPREAALETALAAVREVHAAEGDAGRAHLAALDVVAGWRERSGRGYVVDALWSAWDAFLGSGSYRDTIVRAVGYGHDTDTTAAIAGGLAGVWWGRQGIPRDWIEGMRGHELVDPMMARLLRLPPTEPRVVRA